MGEDFEPLSDEEYTRLYVEYVQGLHRYLMLVGADQRREENGK